MKLILVLFAAFLANSAHATDLVNVGNCGEKAKAYAEQLDSVVSENEGPFQGDSPYVNDPVLDEQTEKKETDGPSSYIETFLINIDHFNEDNDWWVDTYKIKMLAYFLGGDQKVASCAIKGFEYVGVTESGGPEDQEE